MGSAEFNKMVTRNVKTREPVPLADLASGHAVSVCSTLIHELLQKDPTERLSVTNAIPRLKRLTWTYYTPREILDEYINPDVLSHVRLARVLPEQVMVLVRGELERLKCQTNEEKLLELLKIRSENLTRPHSEVRCKPVPLVCRRRLANQDLIDRFIRESERCEQS